MTIRAAVLLFALLSLVQAQSAPSKNAAQEARKKLFRERFLDHFALGVEAPTEWITETREKNNCRWDCKVDYFSGGAIPGEKPFWLNYGNSPQKYVAEARKAGVVEWCTFYNLANSAPAKYKPGPAEATATNAKIPATMKEYFQLFKTFLEGCAKEAPWPVMVHIEPDEWCHLLLTAAMDPAKVDVKVGSCGMEELKGLPDNLIGFAAAFKRLRDQIAPINVLLGCTPSAWDSTGAMSGPRMGQTMKQIAGDWDFAVFETGDRDKGSKGTLPSYGNAIDRTGNLENHLKWISEFRAASGLYVFVWQVSAGNTYFSTCNNTPGHYGDNLAQMLLEDYPQNPTIGRYVKSGCLGWMFNTGIESSTHVYDYTKDGITNPPPVPGNQGHKSEYADDDGGYMRLRGGAYYRKPYPVLGKAGEKAVDASTATTAGKSEPKATTSVAPATLASWGGKLRTALTDDLKGGRRIRFMLKALGQTSEISCIDEKGILTMQSETGTFPLPWSDLTVPDLRNLATARLRDSRSSGDLCLAAFFQMASGRDAEAQTLLKGATPADAEEVVAAFKPR